MRCSAPRLGLSATPERAGDPEGTAAILDFFGGVLEPRFTLADAIAADVLTPYFYRPHRVELSDDEIEEWREVSRRLARAMFAGGEPADGGIPRSAEMLLFERARIVKAAAAKVPLAVEILTAEYRPGQRWIVYCDSEAQLADVRSALRAAGFSPRAYTSAMPADREATHPVVHGHRRDPRRHPVLRRGGRHPRDHPRADPRLVEEPAGVHPAAGPGAAEGGRQDARVRPRRDRRPAPAARRRGRAARPDHGGGTLPRLQFAQGAANHGAAADLLDIAIDAGIDWRTMFSMGVEDQDDD